MAILLFKQLVQLFIMIALGFVLVKSKLLSSKDSRILSVICIYLIYPCVIVNAFQVDYSKEIAAGFTLALVAAILIHVVLLVLVGILGKALSLDNVEKASLIYSNAGNLIIPLVTAMFGQEYVIYASGFMFVQTFLIFTHGAALMSGSKKFEWKKIVTNVNVISTLVGLLLFLFHIKLPAMVKGVTSSMSALVGPVSMIMIGMILADADWKRVLTNKRIYLLTALRLIGIPLVILCLLKFTPLYQMAPDGRTILMISLMATMTPAASTITQMSQLYNNKPEYTASINVMTTVFCIATMPLLIALYEL